MIKPATFPFFGTTASAAAHLILFYSLDTFTPLPLSLSPSLPTVWVLPDVSVCASESEPCLCVLPRVVVGVRKRSSCAEHLAVERRMKRSQGIRYAEDGNLKLKTFSLSVICKHPRAADYLQHCLYRCSLPLHKIIYIIGLFLFRTAAFYTS